MAFALSGRRRGIGTLAGVTSALRISASRGRRLGSGMGPESGCEAESESLASKPFAPGCADASAPVAALPSAVASGDGGNTLAREAPGAVSWSAVRSPAVDPVGSVLSAGSVDALASTIGADRAVVSWLVAAPSARDEGALMLAVETS